jgi:hypothetical protein
VLRNVLLGAVWLGVLLGAVLPAFGQTAQISGQVTDPQGAAVAGADVHVINEDSSVDTTATGGGIAYPQPNAAPAFSGSYGLSYVAGDGTEASGQMTADSAGSSLTGQISVDPFGRASPFSGSFTSGAKGRFAGSLALPNGAPAGAFYLADPTQGFFIQNDGVQVSLGYFSAQSALQ